MNRLFHVGLTAALVVGALFVGARLGRRPSASNNHASARRILYYVDPMNPAHTSDRPGLAPCGMNLEPVYADEAAGGGSRGHLAALPAGSFQVRPDKQQLIGVRTALVEKKPLRHTRRLLGRVAVDETRVYWINATVDGWITKAFPAATGDYVERNQVLASFYSPEFLSAGNALLFALNSKDRVHSTGVTTNAADGSRLAQFEINLQQYRDALHNLGMGEPQIQEMIDTRRFRRTIDLVAPADGFIVARNVSEGLRFEQGTELYRIADLDRVWILADLPEGDLEFMPPGRTVGVTCPRQPGSWTATVSRALPRFDSVSRTLKVRLEADNPDYRLKPDMFVDLELGIEVPEGVFVPVDALVDAGEHACVFVEQGGGAFESRPVQTGRRLGDTVEVLHGLAAGEKIACSGTFLLDSESRMKRAAAGLHDLPARDPVCGMAVEPSAARESGLVSLHQGVALYFCQETCRRRFEQDPETYLKSRAEPGPPEPAATVAAEGMRQRYRPSPRPAPPVREEAPLSPSAAAPARPGVPDPVCGMNVEVEGATAGGRTCLHEGRVYYFCSDNCKRSFEEDPAWILTEITPSHTRAAPAPVPSHPANP